MGSQRVGHNWVTELNWMFQRPKVTGSVVTSNIRRRKPGARGMQSGAGGMRPPWYGEPNHLPLDSSFHIINLLLSCWSSHDFFHSCNHIIFTNHLNYYFLKDSSFKKCTQKNKLLIWRPNKIELDTTKKVQRQHTGWEKISESLCFLT